MKKKIVSPKKAPTARKRSVKRTARPARKKIVGEVLRIGLHNLKRPAGSHKKRKILGRGPSSGHGKTSTRGSKGQTSRSGPGTYLGFEGGQMPLIRRIPKRGFTNPFKRDYQIVNLADLGKIKAEIINPEVLENSGLIKNKNRWIKVLGDGEIKNPVTVQAHAFSRSALDKITNSGGKAEVIPNA